MPIDNVLSETTERLIARGRAAEAAEQLADRMRSGKGDLSTRISYAYALSATGNSEDSVICARETVLLFPRELKAILCLGEMLRRAEQLPEAITEFRKVLDIDPHANEALFLLGCAWLDAGEAHRALTYFAETDPATPGLQEKGCQAELMLARPRSDAAYVRHLFDQFSADYDTHMLGRLHYRAPALLRQLFDTLRPPRQTDVRDLAVLDLGCGTGLAGEAFKDLASRLIGIDLSPRMIERARVRAIYDAFHLADIEALPAAAASFDLALAADTLVYLGDLGKVLTAVHRILKPGGLFLFSVEQKSGGGFDLGPKRRWRHSERYLKDCARVAGFELSGLMSCTLRAERYVDVAGFAVALGKP